MKRILVVIFIFYGFSIQAQINPQAIDIPQEKISTGILYNRVIPFAGLQVFGQNGRKDTSNHKHFTQAYYELYQASYTNNKMLTLEQLHNWVRYKKENNTILLGVIQYSFNYTEDLSLEKIQKKNSTILNSKNLKLNSLSSFVVSPLSEEPLQVGKSFQIELHEKLIFSNTSIQLVSLQADFGEGKIFNFRKGSKFLLNYNTMGTKIIRFVGKMSDGSEKVTYARIVVENSDIANRTTSIPPCFVREGTNRIKSTIIFNPYEPENFGGAPVEVELGYYYASNKGCNGQQSLTKPILIIDGFDPEDSRSIGEIYGENLSYNNNTQNFGLELRNQGYDVIIANFPVYQVGTDGNGNPVYRDGGADYIERNAMGIVEVIKTLNQELQSGSTEQLIVVGPSMGGLISRYSLSYMEKNGLNHNTKLWVSFDSPHNGANISIGAQEFLRYWGANGSGGAQTAYDIKINSKAAKQMLLWHRNVGNFPATPTAHWYRNIFIQNLNNNGIYGSSGFPTKLKRIALVNGSGSGQLSGVAGAKNLQMDLWFQLLGGNASNVGNAWINSTGSYGNMASTIYSWSFGETPVLHSATSNTNSVSYDIAPGGTYDTYKEVVDAGTDPVCINLWVFSNNASTCAPQNGTWGAWIKPVYVMNQSYHSFIPTKSALAFRGTNQDLGEAINNRDLTCTGETPFEAYYAPNENQDHVSLTQASVDWLLSQFNSIPAPVLVCGSHQSFTLTKCASNTENVTVKTSFNLSKGVYNNGIVPIKAIASGDGFVEFWRGDVRLQRYEVRAIVPKVSDISGPVSVCSTPATFTLNNLPSGVTATWQTSPNLSPSSGSGTVATISSVGTGEAWIEYTIGSCGQKLRHYINSLSRVEMEGSKYICSPATRQYSVPLYTGATYTWTSTPNVTITNVAPNIVNVTGLTNGQGWVRVNIAVNSGCLTESRLIHKAIWVGLPTVPIITQPTGVTPVAPNTYAFTYYKTLNNLTYTLRFNSGGTDRIVYTVDNPSLYPLMSTPDLPEGWFELTGYPTNSLSFIPNRMDEGTYTFTLMGQNDCNNNPFAETAPKTTVIITIGGLAARQLNTTTTNVYPNPTENELVIESQGKNTFELYNKFNKLVLSGEFLDKHIVHLRKLPQDVYFLHITDEKGNKTQTKIVVQK